MVKKGKKNEDDEPFNIAEMYKDDGMLDDLGGLGMDSLAEQLLAEEQGKNEQNGK